MLETYQGILRDNQIEWTGDPPRRLPAEQGVRVHVTLLEKATGSDAQGQRMALALERLAALGGVTDISDPMSWEREMRQDRPLPGRGE